MDPNTVLMLLRKHMESDSDSWDENDRWLVKQYFEALDEWLSRGGFLPEAWVTDTVKRQMED